MASHYQDAMAHVLTAIHHLWAITMIGWDATFTATKLFSSSESKPGNVPRPAATMAFLHFLVNQLFNLNLFIWDAILSLVNYYLPDVRPGQKTDVAKDGFGWVWPKYIPPKEGDSRCACPALNALANHGILPHDGRNIRFTDATEASCANYNISLPFSVILSNSGADILHRNYFKDKFDLYELSIHNATEHDASLCREDTFHNADQSVIATARIEQLLSSASGKDADGKPIIVAKDLSDALSRARVNSMEHNPEFHLEVRHKLFSSVNASFFLSIFGGNVEDLRLFLIEERVSDDWKPKNKAWHGLTVMKALVDTSKIALGLL